MNGRTTNWGRTFGLALLALTAFGAAGCPGDDDNDSGDGGMSGFPGLGDLTKQCGLSCPEKGIVDGNASISGYSAIDGYFRSVVNFNTVAAGATADLDSELRGIQVLFGISDAEANANLQAAITAKLAARYQASVVVKSQPARCGVDASIAAKASVQCQAEAKCDVDPGKASFTCMGTCTVDANVSGGCDANAEVRCEVVDPSFTCNGSCDGTCSVKLDAAASCSGTCNGTCSGECVGDTDSGAGCSGQCMGMCQGSCDTNLEASAMCMGSCQGSCKYNPGSASCSANAKVTCDLKASAMAECSGRCDGEFTPPKASCQASASCEASAKAEAKFQVVCTPPTIDVRLVSTGSVEVQAQAAFLLSELKARLPRLSAAVGRAKVVNQAGGELVESGRAAVSGTLGAFGQGEVGVIAAYKIATCVPAQLTASTGAITTASKNLSDKMSAADSVAKAFGMVM